MNWVNPDSIYKNKKKNRIVIKSAQKESLTSTIRSLSKDKGASEKDKREMLEFYIPHIRNHREKRHSVGMGHHTSLLKSNRKRGLSETMNLKLLSETMSLAKK